MNSSIPFSILSFNMHGFSQGESFLSDVCAGLHHDVIFLQEHWLNSDQVTKITNFNANYVGFGESAMSKTTTSGILYGRPYGGVCSLVRKSLCGKVSCKLIAERMVAISICNSLFINVYLPCDDGSIEAYDQILDILSEATRIVDEGKYDYIFFGGDLNTDLNHNRKNAVLIKNFLSSYKLSFKNPVDKNYVECPTFGNEKRNCFSTIDFICYSDILLQYISQYRIVEGFNNFSDHEGLEINFSLPIGNMLGARIYNCVHGHGTAPSAAQAELSNGPTARAEVVSLRFDHGNIAAYYEHTGLILQPILEEINLAMSMDSASNNDCTWGWRCPSVTVAQIEDWYERIVAALHKAATLFIPKVKSSALKFWWDEALDELKKASMLSHQLWIDAGKPRNGTIFQKRT